MKDEMDRMIEREREETRGKLLALERLFLIKKDQ
jgi:hypothetical protein